MRAGNAYHRVKFFEKQITRDSYGASSDSWDYNNPTITTNGEIRYTGGGKAVQNEEKIYSKNVELIVRYRSTITETMKIQIDATNDIWVISYLEILGRKQDLRLTIEKSQESLSNTIVESPTNFTAVLDAEIKVDLNWTNNLDDDPVSIERSEDGNSFEEIYRTAAEVTSYSDESGEEETKYYYRIRHFHYLNYSAYTQVEIVTTETIIL